MDAPSVSYSQDRFEFIKNKMVHLLIDIIGFREEGISFVPVSATDGDNLIPIDPNEKGSFFRRKKSRYVGIAELSANGSSYSNANLSIRSKSSCSTWISAF